MKYIIEIKPEYEDSFKGLMILGAKDSNLFVDTLAVENLEELNSDYINEHFGDLQDTAYQRGLEEGKKAFDLLDAERDAEYQRGLEDGKAVNDKGCEGCMYQDKTIEHHPCGVCCNAYNNMWTAKQTDDEIKVGDEVCCKGDDISDSGVVTWVGKKRVCAMWQDGSAGEVEKDELIKTNRHFDIASILKEMQS